MDEAIKNTETFVESVRGIQLQEQLRINHSYHEIVERFKVGSKNETKFHGEQMNTLLESLSSNIEEFSVAEKNGENAVESLQNTLHQEQNRFNAFDVILENFRTIEELTTRQQKDYEVLMKKQSTVAFLAYTTKRQDITSNTIIKFEKVWTNIGNEYNPSTGIFTAPRQGVYHISAVVLSVSGISLHLHVKHNNVYTAGSYINGAGYRPGTFDVVLNLNEGDNVSVGSKGHYDVYSDSNGYTTFSGHLITKRDSRFQLRMVLDFSWTFLDALYSQF